MNIEERTETNPTDSEIREPCTTLANRSLPWASVPNQCSAEGGSSRLVTSCAITFVL